MISVWGQVTNRIRAIAASIVVFLLILIPRVASLTTFLTADEDDQLRFAQQFLSAIVRRDWAGALVLGYPGVPTMTLGGFGLWFQYKLEGISWQSFLSRAPSPSPSPTNLPHQIFLPLVMNTRASLETYLAAVTLEPLRFILAARLPLAMAATLTLFIAWLLLRRLLSPRLALLAIILIAFDPFLLANSRVIHVDAPLAYFMLVSFLAFLVYLKRGHWGWLTLSGVFGGLAILSKTPGVMLAPILLVGGGLYAYFVRKTGQNTQYSFRRFAIAIALWGAIVAAAFFAFWPSMWANPVFALSRIAQNIISVSGAPHPSSGEFWGRIVTDRSPLYYLVAFPFHLTPLASIGLAMGLFSVFIGWRALRQQRRNFNTDHLPLVLASLAFIVIFTIAISVISKRITRYMLPAFPIFNLIAAIGLGSVVAWIGKRWAYWVLALAIAFQSVVVLTYHPYYFNYFNPLLGGGNNAARYVVIGWGEGLNRAADYLNQKPNAPETTVAAWYSWQFAPYFDGETVDLASNEPAYGSDYTVFYLNQIQRGFPSKELLGYFADRQPEKIITLNNVDYAWIYPGPIIGQTLPADLSDPLNLPFNDAVTLLGFDKAGEQVSRCAGGQRRAFSPAHLPTCPPAHSVTLYWQVNAPLPADLNVSIRVVDDEGVVWGQVDRLPIGGLVRSDDWQPGDVIRDEYLLPLDPAAPPGSYTFDILMYNFNTGEIFGQANGVGSLTLAPSSAPVDAETLTALPDFQPSSFILQPSALSLLGHTSLLTQTLPGHRQTLKLYWQAKQSPQEDYIVTFAARPASGGEARILFTETIGSPEYPTGNWKKDQIVAEAYALAFPPDASPGEYEMLLEGGRQKDEGGNKNSSFILHPSSLSLGKITLLEQPHIFDLPPETTPLNAVLGAKGEVNLLAYHLSPEGDLALYWQATQILNDDYKVFVHLTDAGDAIIAQRDSIPANGARPTTTWLPGEIVSDSYTLPFPLLPGSYRLWVGLYNPRTGERFPVPNTPDNRLLLTELEVTE